MIVPIIVDLAETHWHKILLESFNALKTTLKEIDPIAFDRVLQEPKDTIKANSLNAMHNIAKRSGIEAQWEALTIKAKTVDPSFVPPVIPYIENHVVGLHNMNSIELSSNNLIPLF
jgi:serine/threonine-protein phosphatase 2A regulatory subunit B'